MKMIATVLGDIVASPEAMLVTFALPLLYLLYEVAQFNPVRADLFRGMARRRKQYPNQPWRWSRYWECGRIPYGPRTTPAVQWRRALLLIGLLAWTAGFVIPRVTTYASMKSVFVLGLLFFLATSILVHAYRMQSWWRSSGGAELVLDTRPGMVGGELRGHVEASLTMGPWDELRLRLSCLRREEGQSDAVLFESEVPIRACALDHFNIGRIEVPFDFEIPQHVPSTRLEEGGDRIEWTLTLWGDLIASPYYSQFEVPIFEAVRTPRVSRPKPVGAVLS